MKRIYSLLISMQVMSAFLVMYALAMAIATFIENDYGARVAKNIVYNAWWFELIQFMLVINMVGNIFKYKLYKKQKLSILLFHLAFIIILIGAGVTRYISYEGTMHIREGETSNKLYSLNSFLQIDLAEGEKKMEYKNPLFISPSLKTDFKESFSFNNKELEIELKNVIPNPKHTAIEVIDGQPIVEIVFSSAGHMDNHFIEDNAFISHAGLNFSLNGESNNYVAQFISENEKLFIKSPFEVKVLSMTGGNDSVITAGEKYEIQIRQLYSVKDQKFVITNHYEKAKLEYIPGDTKNGVRFFAIKFDVKSNNTTKSIDLISASGASGEPLSIEINDIKLNMIYGVQEIQLPFALKLRDFQLDRYPGSESPSSYASEITLIDDKNNINEDHRIYMNNVLDYSGYRFFQSSYDRDEQGTILSVNKDKAGTFLTYIGYFLLSLGMFWSLFNKNSYFVELYKRTGEIRNKRKGITTIILFFLFFGAQNAYAQNNQKHIDKDHAKEFGKLFVQDNTSRVKPYNTLSSELLRKISRKDKFLGLNSNQVFLGMIFNPQYWQGVKMIKVSYPALKELLGIEEGSYVSFNDLVDLKKQEYKLKTYIDEAFKKDPAQRNKFDKDVIAVDERLNIAYQIYSGTFLKVFPVPEDKNKKWLTPAQNKQIKDSVTRHFVSEAFTLYYNEVIASQKSGNWIKSNEMLNAIKEFQVKHGSEIIPSEKKLNLEVHYINADIFNRIYKYYGLVGFIFLIILFVGILKPKMKIKIITIVASVLLGVLFLLHTYGLGLRWYISGHAPWSNGYESMIYIAWATMLAGFLFMKRSPITLAATSLLASITLMVAHLSWMDPQITNLVPVLKSYWLTIHVSIITASYGFLALGALLGFLTLVLMIFRNKKNSININLTISELTNVNHMTIIAGLYLLTIGTFLGGVWANESWGRYWGWDPKETWALITVIVYSIVTHIRFIPALNNKYAFNLFSLLSFSSVIMTYFGVNYYLSGLHSYASGDPMPIPNFVYYTLGVVFIVAIAAYIKNLRNKNLLIKD